MTENRKEEESFGRYSWRQRRGLIWKEIVPVVRSGIAMAKGRRRRVSEPPW